VKLTLDAALKAMSDAFPHGRDYQLNMAEYVPAREAWEERMKLIAVMSREFEEQVLAINEGDK
jgi:hypothetical protein